MLSRVAERIYWGGRYLERAENTARMISTYAGLLLDLPDEASFEWRHLLAIADAEALFDEEYGSASEKNVLAFLITDVENPASVVSSLAFARENFRTTRDVLPREAWESINKLYNFSQEKMRRTVSRRQLDTVLTRCVRSCQQVTGALGETLSHGNAHRFLTIGRTLERSDMNSRTLSAVATAFPADDLTLARYEDTLWMAVLQSQSAYQMYRQYVRRRVVRQDVLAFLAKDMSFPRSMGHCLARLADSLARLPRHQTTHETVLILLERIHTTDVETLAGPSLRDWIEGLQTDFAAVHDAIVNTWFLPSHAA